PAAPDPGLCAGCVHSRVVSGRATSFWLCRRSETDAAYPRYPRRPLLECRGYVDAVVTTGLWRQFGAALDMLEGSIAACPDELWAEPVWPETPPEWFPPNFAAFWYVSYHTLVWLDIYLRGVPED